MRSPVEFVQIKRTKKLSYSTPTFRSSNDEEEPAKGAEAKPPVR